VNIAASMKAKLKQLSYFSQKFLRICAVEQKREAKASSKEDEVLADQPLFSKCT
jgi:hypothetical protein